ncbi:ROK family protein [Microbacterium sp. NPDC091313]
MDVALAVDLGGTKVEAALVDAAGAVLDGSRARAATGPDADAAALRAAVHEVVGRAVAATPAGATLRGAGIGSAGPVDVAAGTVSPLNLPRAAGFSLARIVREALPADELPVRLALDGQCIAIAESRFGAGRGARIMLGMVVSTGIGGGIVVDGRALPGGTGNAGHIGQIEVAGFTASGGLDATVERVASGPNIVAWARAQGWQGDSGEDLAAAAAAGDDLARAAVRRSAAAVGSALASASALLDLDAIVIGGGFSRVSPDYVDLVREARDAVGAFAFLARARIVPAALGDESPLVGAAALVLDA